MTRSALQDELRKKLPFDSPEQEAFLNLLRTADHGQTAFAELFQEYKLSSPQYNVLRILRGHGKPVACQDVAAQMISRMPDVTRLLDRLEEADPPLVQRRRSEEDRRVVLVSIAPAGLDLLARLDAPVAELHRSLLGHLTRTELAELNRLLVKARRPE
jgi:MarR family transcriptional regulator, 2-MHQ and catechol-resistance regulon repressor